MSDVAPTELRFSAGNRTLTLVHGDGRRAKVGYRNLRAHSPSAETRGHGANRIAVDPERFPEDIDVTNAEPVGHYAVRLTFSDGHSTGLYTWALLNEISQ